MHRTIQGGQNRLKRKPAEASIWDLTGREDWKAQTGLDAAQAPMCYKGLMQAFGRVAAKAYSPMLHTRYAVLSTFDNVTPNATHSPSWVSH